MVEILKKEKKRKNDICLLYAITVVTTMTVGRTPTHAYSYFI